MLLAGLLDLTGGPFNPFSVVFVVTSRWPALTLGTRDPRPGRRRGAAVGLRRCCIYRHTLEEIARHTIGSNDFPTHLFTMWIAVAATAELAAYFVVQASRARSTRSELERCASAARSGWCR